MSRKGGRRGPSVHDREMHTFEVCVYALLPSSSTLARAERCSPGSYAVRRRPFLFEVA